MASERAGARAPPFIDPPGYARHRPEGTLLYQLVERYPSPQRIRGLLLTPPSRGQFFAD